MFRNILGSSVQFQDANVTFRPSSNLESLLPNERIHFRRSPNSIVYRPMGGKGASCGGLSGSWSITSRIRLPRGMKDVIMCQWSVDSPQSSGGISKCRAVSCALQPRSTQRLTTVIPQTTGGSLLTEIDLCNAKNTI